MQRGVWPASPPCNLPPDGAILSDTWIDRGGRSRTKTRQMWPRPRLGMSVPSNACIGGTSRAFIAPPRACSGKRRLTTPRRMSSFAPGSASVSFAAIPPSEPGSFGSESTSCSRAARWSRSAIDATWTMPISWRRSRRAVRPQTSESTSSRPCRAAAGHASDLRAPRHRGVQA